MLAQTADHDVFLPFVHPFLHFFQREVHDVVVVHFQWRYGVTETQPQPVQKIDFVGGQIRVRAARGPCKPCPQLGR